MSSLDLSFSSMTSALFAELASSREKCSMMTWAIFSQGRIFANA
jgi:hypothetical protein